MNNIIANTASTSGTQNTTTAAASRVSKRAANPIRAEAQSEKPPASVVDDLVLIDTEAGQACAAESNNAKSLVPLAAIADDSGQATAERKPEPTESGAPEMPPAPARPREAGQPVNGHVPVASLRVHEDNLKVYGEKESIADIVKSVRKFGVLDPLLITKDMRIISGHRRFRAAQELKVEEVPVRVFESMDELQVKTALLEHNRQRIKTKVQIANEASLMLEIEKQLRARRTQDPSKRGQVENFPPKKSRDNVGEKLGISGKTVDKAAKVSVAVGKLRADGKEEVAIEIEKKLKKSVDAGYKAAIAEGLITTRPKKKASSKAKRQGTTLPTSGSAASSQPDRPATLKLDSDAAMEMADQVLSFLRGLENGCLTEQQKDDWKRLFEEFDDCRADLGL